MPALCPKGKMKYKVTEDREDEVLPQATKEYPPGVDQDGAWLKKRGKFHFEYKKHFVTDNKGLVSGVMTTKASTNEIANLAEVLDSADLPKGIQLKLIKVMRLRKMPTC